jgi:hypothetical protein
MSKIILDLCGGTGSWSKPYKEAGYDVKLITLPKYDLFDTHTHTHTRMIEFRNSFTEEIEAVNADEVYGILAAPTCTMFSLARTTAKTPRDFESGMKLVEKCLEIIWYCRASNDSALKFWALENPQGYLRQFLGRPPFTFSPEEYGENYTKKTDIWGYFNISKKNPYRLSPDEQLLSCRNNRVLPELPDDYIMPEGWNRQAARRSMTSKRFAEAFYKANK